MYIETIFGLCGYLLIGLVISLIANEGWTDIEEVVIFSLFWPMFLLIVVLNHFVDLLIKLWKGDKK